MKKKRLHLILIIFSFTVFFAMALMFTGCSLDQDFWDAREETEAKAAEQEVKEEQIRALEENENQSEETATADEGSFPGEPIAYTSTVDWALVTLIVNFKTTEVTGSISESGNTYFDADIKGKINIDTLEITSKLFRN